MLIKMVKKQGIYTGCFAMLSELDGYVIYSNKGTTRGDPLAMPVYVLSTIPLLCRLPKNVTQAQMIQVSVVKFHTCVCGGTSFHYLDHI